MVFNWKLEMFAKTSRNRLSNSDLAPWEGKLDDTKIKVPGPPVHELGSIFISSGSRSSDNAQPCHGLIVIRPQKLQSGLPIVAPFAPLEKPPSQPGKGIPVFAPSG